MPVQMKETERNLNEDNSMIKILAICLTKHIRKPYTI